MSHLRSQVLGVGGSQDELEAPAEASKRAELLRLRERGLAPGEGMTVTCRCGHVEGVGPHKCHGKGYECENPGTRRFYNARPATLSGVQPKLVADDTWACDECWEEFTKRVKVPEKAR